MKREIATNCLQLGDHRVIVDAGSRAEAHWLGLGYGLAGGSVSGEAAMAVVDSGCPEISATEVSKRRGRPRKGDD